MRLGLNKEQWDRLLEHSDKISAMPTIVSDFLRYFTAEDKPYGNFNIAYDPERKVYGVWYNDLLDKFEDKELIDAMFNLFCFLEEI